MTEREKLIAGAAIRVFSRYGVKRVTMNDIAEEAGVVRQTLYNIYPNKNAVIRGAIMFYSESQRDMTRKDWATAESLSEKLDILFQHHVITPWDLVAATPDANDLETAVNEAAADALDDAARQAEAMLAGLFAPFGAVLSSAGQDPAGLAQFVQTAMNGIKHGAADHRALMQLIGTLKTSVLVLTGQAEMGKASSTGK